jgi:hypothetical protein
MHTGRLVTRLAAPAALAVVGALAAAGFGAVLPGHASRDGAANRARGFVIAESAAGLYPGARGRLRLVLRNPYRFAIKVTTLSVRVGDAQRCDGRWLRPRKLGRPVIVPRMGTRRVTLPLAMAVGAPDGCQDARFPLRFHGTAVKA